MMILASTTLWIDVDDDDNEDAIAAYDDDVDADEDFKEDRKLQVWRGIGLFKLDDTTMILKSPIFSDDDDDNDNVVVAANDYEDEVDADEDCKEDGKLQAGPGKIQ